MMLDCLLINFQLNKGSTNIYPESNGYTTYVVTILLEMNSTTYFCHMNSLLDTEDKSF